jgi:ABC-type Fe3+-hydroxamate transport system substrate-binding protein
MSSRLTRGIILVTSLALAVAGCGSSSSSSSSSKSTSTPAITKAEFLKKGNAICKNGNKEINKAAKTVFAKGKKPSHAEMMNFATGTIIPSVQRQISGVKALGAPKGDEAKVKAIVTTAQAALDKGKKDPAILVSNKRDPFAKSNKLTKAYGLKACGGGGG